MPRYRKKAIEIEAVLYHFIEDDAAIFETYPPQWLLDAMDLDEGADGEVFWTETGLFIRTLEGVHEASPGDFILRGVKGELYPCKPDIFEATYVDADVMSFGDAIEAMRAGKRVARKGWNGKGMWVAMTPGSTFKADNARSGAALHVANAEQVSEITVLPHIDMRAADGSLVIGWLASQTDMLAKDWEIVSAPVEANQIEFTTHPDARIRSRS